ncbi:MAG: polyphosphate--glucose phosphotransferase [Candidatus Limnocylindrales bacterium]
MSTSDATATAAETTTTTTGAGAAPAAATAKAVPLTGVALGIDVGGTGTKAAMIDLATAELVTSRIREKTPQPSEPEAVIDVIGGIVERVLEEYGPIKELPIGCGLPGPIKFGRMKMAANLDKGWVDFDATGVLGTRLGRPVHVINDADAAGMAELAYGEAHGREGTTILLTLGTGIGSAVISEGRLVPNTELGHLEMHDHAAETLISGVSRERRGLKWKPWAKEFNEYLAMLEFFFWPDRIILGGGLSKRSDKYWPYLETNADLVKAKYLNTSGIIGAAYAAGLAVHEEAVAAAAATAARKPAARRRSTRGSASGKRG